MNWKSTDLPLFKKYPILQILVLWIWLSLQFVNNVLSANEENYFALARQFFDPQWLPNVPLLTEFPGTRILYQYITGFGLSIMSFEAFALLGGLVSILLLAIPLSKIFNHLKLSLVEMLIILQLYIFVDQSFFAKGWIFGGFEAKSFAYILVLFAILQVLRGRQGLAIVLTAFATLFHVLVGGWFTLGLGVYLLISKFPFKKLVGYGLLWLAITAPLIIYLVSEVLLVKYSTEQQQLADYVYTHIRAPHHTAMFESMRVFWHSRIFRIGGMAIIMLAMFWFRPKDDNWNVIRKLYIVLALMLLVNLGISAFDEYGSFTKYYPFRMATVALLLGVTLLLKFATVINPFKNLDFWFKMAAFAVVIVLFGQNVRSNLTEKPQDDNELYAFAKNISDKDDVFYFIAAKDFYDPDLAFNRKAERPRFFVYKFVPSDTGGILEWNRRFQKSTLLQEDINNIEEVLQTDRINYIVSESPLENSKLRLVKKIDQRYLYQVI